MAKTIYRDEEAFQRDAERYISKLFPNDLKDILKFYQDLQADSLSPSRVNKYLVTLVSMSRRLGKAFNVATDQDIKKFVIGLYRSDYSDWTKHDHKIILRKYMRWLGKEDIVQRIHRIPAR